MTGVSVPSFVTADADLAVSRGGCTLAEMRTCGTLARTSEPFTSLDHAYPSTLLTLTDGARAMPRNRNQPMTTKPRTITDRNGTLYLLPPIDEPRLDETLRPLRVYRRREAAIMFAPCPHCGARPGSACTDDGLARRPHWSRLRILKGCFS